MVRFGNWIVRHRVLILIIGILLMIPSVIGMVTTRVNYDMLAYLPDDMDTVIGQDILLDDFGKGAFSMVMVEGMEPKDVSALKEKIEEVDHVDRSSGMIPLRIFRSRWSFCRKNIMMRSIRRRHDHDGGVL